MCHNLVMLMNLMTMNTNKMGVSNNTNNKKSLKDKKNINKTYRINHW